MNKEKVFISSICSQGTPLEDCQFKPRESGTGSYKDAVRCSRKDKSCKLNSMVTAGWESSFSRYDVNCGFRYSSTLPRGSPVLLERREKEKERLHVRILQLGEVFGVRMSNHWHRQTRGWQSGTLQRLLQSVWRHALRHCEFISL